MISVCLASYNGEKYIREQLNSILKQLGEQDEVIISDDGSIDRTLEIIKSIHDPRVIILNNLKVKSKFTFDYVTHNFETALKACSGDYIFLSDQDDIWLPNKVSLFMKELSKYDLVLSDCTVVGELLEQMYASYFLANKSRTGVLKNIYRNSYLGCCMAFRRCVLKKALPFPKSGVPHDIWIGIISELYYKIKLIPIPTLLYRRHSDNISPSGGASHFPFRKKVYLRWKLVFELIKKHIK